MVISGARDDRETFTFAMLLLDEQQPGDRDCEIAVARRERLACRRLDAREQRGRHEAIPRARSASASARRVRAASVTAPRANSESATPAAAAPACQIVNSRGVTRRTTTRVRRGGRRG